MSRSDRDVQTVLFTVSESANVQLDASEAEFALELFEKLVKNASVRQQVEPRHLFIL